MRSVIKKISKTCKKILDPFRALSRGEFFASSLQNQLVTLEALQEVLQQLSLLKTEQSKIIQQIPRSGSIMPFICEDGLANQNMPEESLIAFLFPLLGNRKAIDIGAHRGRFSLFLLRTGFSEVYAVEPHPKLVQDLKAIARQNRQLQVIACAVGAKNGRSPLYLVEDLNGAFRDTDLLLLSATKTHPMPQGLAFRESLQVPMRSFSSLLRKGDIPGKAGFLKVDIEGADGVVLSQIPSGHPYDAILTEFWGKKFVFCDPQSSHRTGSQAPLPNYPFTLSLARHKDKSLSFTANKSPTDQEAWGNTFHFHDQNLFYAAYRFIQNKIPEAV